jgi:hypothetical protein
MTQLKQFKTLFTAVACFWLAACAVQQTRVQHNAIPVSFVPTGEENAYGERIFGSLSEDYPIDTASPRHDQLKDLFDHLAVNPGDWQVYLFDAPDIADIRAVHGNYIFVWSGVFDVIDNDDELAGLLACEMAHALARHTDPVEFSLASEFLFSLADTATTVGLLLLTQGAVNINGNGFSRWAYVEAADLDPVDRVYSDKQVEDMAAIALLILDASDYSPAGLLQFWKRAESNDLLQEQAKRLSRDIPPNERVAIFEAVLPKLSAARKREEEPADVVGHAANSGENDSI